MMMNMLVMMSILMIIVAMIMMMAEMMMLMYVTSIIQLRLPHCLPPTSSKRGRVETISKVDNILSSDGLEETHSKRLD